MRCDSCGGDGRRRRASGRALARRASAGTSSASAQTAPPPARARTLRTSCPTRGRRTCLWPGRGLERECLGGRAAGLATPSSRDSHESSRVSFYATGRAGVLLAASRLRHGPTSFVVGPVSRLRRIPRLRRRLPRRRRPEVAVVLLSAVVVGGRFGLEPCGCLLAKLAKGSRVSRSRGLVATRGLDLPATSASACRLAPRFASRYPPSPTPPRHTARARQQQADNDPQDGLPHPSLPLPCLDTTPIRCPAQRQNLHGGPGRASVSR